MQLRRPLRFRPAQADFNPFDLGPQAIILREQPHQMMMTALQSTRYVPYVIPHGSDAQRQHTIIVGNLGNFPVLTVENGIETQNDDADMAEPADAAQDEKTKENLNRTRQGDMRDRTVTPYNDVTWHSDADAFTILLFLCRAALPGPDFYHHRIAVF